MKNIILWRPVGPKELLLIAKSSWMEFPKRLPEQPIFYPVCNEKYAREIASKWTRADAGVAFILRFAVDAEFLSTYERHIVGAKEHEEYWIPAEDLEEFNDNISGDIELVDIIS